MEDGSSNAFSHQSNQNKKFIKKESFHGVLLNRDRLVFAESDCTNQIANFIRVDTRIRALLGKQFDPFVLEMIER